MQLTKKYMPFFASALLMCVALYVFYPDYKYYIDPDGTAYLTISRRYATGDIHRAINGYWSPWASWLTAMLVKWGLSVLPASAVVNTAAATCFLYISQSFFLKFNMARNIQWLLCCTLTIFLCFAIFWQSFDDLWECFFLLSILRIMIAEGYKGKPVLWIACGLLGSLAYFAKAYSFPFFILDTICCTYFICKDNKGLWLKISALSIGSMVLCSMPWVWVLHNKYGIWTTSTAGTLNTSWYLVGHPQWKQGIDLLIPPTYPDSPYYWEDPWTANGATPHFWDSLPLFGLQLLRICYNMYKLLISTLQLSVFFPVIGIIALFSLWSKKLKGLFTAHMQVLIISFLLFPLGYLLVNFESRYLWYMLPISIVLGSHLLRQKVKLQKRAISYSVIILFAISYSVFPLAMLKKLRRVSYYNEKLSYSLPVGSFTSNAAPGRETQQLLAATYIAGSQYYTIPMPDTSKRRLIKEMNRYHVQYYVYISKKPYDQSFVLTDENGKTYPSACADKDGYITVFRVNQ